jgi:hypothetical protein
MRWLTQLFRPSPPVVTGRIENIESTALPAYAGMTAAQRCAAVAEAQSLVALDTMWAAWEARGQSRLGLLYAAVLERKGQLGALLSPGERETIARAERQKAIGAKLPPITGRVGR